VRKCKLCSKEKPDSEFYQWSDGRPRFQCKDCLRARHRSIYHGDIEVGAVTNSKEYKIVYQRLRDLRRSKPRHSGGQSKETKAAWARAHRDHVAANSAVYRAVRSGKMLRPCACEACGVSCKPNAYHPSTAKKLDVRWLCSRCMGLARRKHSVQAELMRLQSIRARCEREAKAVKASAPD
jgi:hypothetical protein